MRNIFKYLAAADLSIATAVSSRLSRKCATMSSGRCSASVSSMSHSTSITKYLVAEVQMYYL